MAGLDHVIDSFLDHLTAERGLARNSIEAYARDLAAFSLTVPAARRRAIRTIGAHDIRRHLVALTERGLSARSQARAMAL